MRLIGSRANLIFSLGFVAWHVSERDFDSDKINLWTDNQFVSMSEMIFLCYLSHWLYRKTSWNESLHTREVWTRLSIYWRYFVLHGVENRKVLQSLARWRVIAIFTHDSLSRKVCSVNEFWRICLYKLKLKISRNLLEHFILLNSHPDTPYDRFTKKKVSETEWKTCDYSLCKQWKK